VKGERKDLNMNTVTQTDRQRLKNCIFYLEYWAYSAPNLNSSSEYRSEKKNMVKALLQLWQTYHEGNHLQGKLEQ
jgi:hypothetical protein